MKKVIIAKRVQCAQSGENLILERELSNEIVGEGLVGVPFVCKDSDFKIIDSDELLTIIPEVDGEEVSYAIRFTLTVEKVPQSEVFK